MRARQRRTGRLRWGMFWAIVLGLGTAYLWPGGYDALHWFLRPWWPGATLPAWAFLVTEPVGALGWPLAWAVWTGVFVIGLVWTADVFGNTWLGFLLASPVVLHSIWLGQVEVFSLLGAALGYLVIRRRDRWPAWVMGLAWLGLLVKPQVGLVLAGVYGWYLWRDRRWGGVVPALVVVGAVLALTLARYGLWPLAWLEVVRTFPDAGGAVWPWGLLVLPLLAWPGLSRLHRVRLALAVGLVAAPYWRHYHLVTLLAVTGSPVVLAWWAQVFRLWLPEAVDVIVPLGVLLDTVWSGWPGRRVVARRLRRQLRRQLPRVAVT